MPAGAEVTRPLPEVATVSVYTGTNVAVTAVDAALSESVQVVAEPAHAPPQVLKVHPGSATASSLTAAAGNDVVQVVPQDRPAGTEVIEPLPVLVTVTLPVPVPLTFTVRVAPLAGSVTLTSPGRSVPTAVGVKRTVMLQVAFAASVTPEQALVTSAKLDAYAPVRLVVSAPVALPPLLRIVMTWSGVAVTPKATAPKSSAPLTGASSARAPGVGWNVAVTVFAASIVTEHGEAVQAPVTPWRSLVPGASVAVTMRVVPASKYCVQEPLVQLKVPGVAATVPIAPFTLPTVSVNCHCRVKVAVTARAALIVNVHVVAVPAVVQSPPQVVNRCRVPSAALPGVSVSVTLVPSKSWTAQVPVLPLAQLMPLPVMVPVPEPLTVTPSVRNRRNSTLTLRFWVIDTVQVRCEALHTAPVPVQA